MIRRWLTVLLCLGLALQGPAARALEQMPCPMEAQMQALLQAGAIDPAELPDCCNDLQTWLDTGQLCKTGNGIHAPATWALLPGLVQIAAAASSSLPELAPLPDRRAPVARHWRPPALG
jgi:hypothetical protein